MNRLKIANKSKCYVIICKLLQEFDSVDAFKICLITSALLNKGEKNIQNISYFFEAFATDICLNKSNLTRVVDSIDYLKKCGVVEIINNQVLLTKQTSVESFDLSTKEKELLLQLINMKKNTMMRFVAQYV